MTLSEESKYQKALEWIHSTARFGSRLGLERISKLLTLLGNPERSCKFVHITGTNGKGSVTAFVASVLKEAGYRTGMYTSPYLEDFRERIMINGKKIPKKALVDLVDEVRPRVEQMVAEGYEHPTEFEINTALGFLYFSREGCDYVALEVGLGGRFDATNVVTPAVSVITTIGYDHMDRLGNTLAQIAFEKAGIIKPGIPVVTGALEDEPFEVIRKKALELNSRLITVGRTPWATVTWEEVSYSLDGQEINVYGPDFTYRNLKVPLLGRHQQQNASIAVAALHAAAPANRERRIYLDEKAISAGIERTVWPGRLEVLHRNPMIILDGAHNPQGAKVLAEAIAGIPRRRLICVYGILGDKCYEEATAHVIPQCDEVIVTRPHTPRALDPGILAGEVKKYCPNVTVESDSNKALDLALNRASEDDAILCCGSLYLVGPARTFIRQRFGISPYGGE
ncbi:MAG TPA: bifunctional folylpolyglutamate synthase/dihydrofolate synthase [Firmicutes bacterium]|nr:bifunctional folylpolyglutamate synthase/dihydrofolate synthase [Candidatus Fermentithermobacillaceae bacterium]